MNKWTRRRLALASAFAGALAVAGCSHTFFQYRPQAAEADRLQGASDTFVRAMEQADEAAIARSIDLRGRRALNELVLRMALEKTEAGQEATAAITLLVVAAAGAAALSHGHVTFDEATVRTIVQAIVERARTTLARQGLNVPALGTSTSHPAPPPANESDADHRARIARDLAQIGVAACRRDLHRVSYDAAIFAHIDLERSPREYESWKHDVGSVHLETYACEGREVLLVLDRYRADESPSVALVRTFAAAEWAGLAPKLDRALGVAP